VAVLNGVLAIAGVIRTIRVSISPAVGVAALLPSHVVVKPAAEIVMMPDV
jgi:hypothetical protein